MNTPAHPDHFQAQPTLHTREDIRAAAGQVIMCGFNGTQVTSEVRELLRETQPLGCIVFARNVESPAQLRELGRELKLLRAGGGEGHGSGSQTQPLMLGIDQEGGRVQRVRAPLTEWPPMCNLGQRDDLALSQAVGAALAAEMRWLHMDVDFAPVLDVHTNPDNPVIGNRALDSDPQVVARHGAAFIRGMQGAGVAACGKHFPGHGDTDVDSHVDLPRVDHSKARLQEVEWVPFKAAVQAGVSAMMTAHVVVSCLDAERPATLSPMVLECLRSELGFAGLLISDDLDMKAVADRFSHEALACQGLAAGVDLFLSCQDPARAVEMYRAVVVGVESGVISRQRLANAAARAVAWRQRYYVAPEADRAAAAQAAERMPSHGELALQLGGAAGA